MKNKAIAKHIFSTRKLPESAAQKLIAAGFNLDEFDFIRVTTQFDENSFLKQLNNPASQARIFTSKNAVRALADLLDKHPIEISKKKNFTVGIKATERLAELGIKSSVRSDNAMILAQIIARNADVKAVDYFCGDQALDDLPEYLASKNIKVHKEIVYHTDLVQEKVSTELFDGLIFLSPSAVYSFFKKNSINGQTPAFCIGATTAEAVRRRCDNPRLIAHKPSIDGVIKRVIEYFQD
jgi:uroporphyrinogen-III synthase